MSHKRDFCSLSGRQKRRLVNSKMTELYEKAKIGSPVVQSVATSRTNDVSLSCDSNANSDLNVSSVTYTKGHQMDDNLVKEVPVDNILKFTQDSPYKQTVIDSECSFQSCRINEPNSQLGNHEFEQKLRLLVLKHHVSQDFLNDLLKLLAKFNLLSSLPKCARTLMHTPRHASSKIAPMGTGTYAHLGLANGICHSIKKFKEAKDLKKIKININIDGLPISKSSSGQFWPVLASVLITPSLYRY